jgi:hypothetical protein
MLGPVFTLELRRWRRSGYLALLPWVYACFLFLQVCGLGDIAALPSPNHPHSGMIYLAGRLPALFAQHLVVLFLLTPALAATSLSEEKARGILPDLFTTAVTATQVVLGKVLGRSLRALQVLLTGLPVLLIAGAFIGLTPLFFVVLLFLTILLVVAVAALSVLAAVVSRHTSGAVLGTYAVLGLGACAVAWLPLRAFDPVYTLQPAWSGAGAGPVLRSVLVPGLAWGAVAALACGVAVWRLRRDALWSAAVRRWWWPLTLRRPAVGENPIRWREYHLIGLAPLPMLRVLPRWAAFLIVFGLSLGASLVALRSGVRPGRAPIPDPFIILAVQFVLASTLVVAVRGATAVAGERERHTWDSLRLTSLDGPEFIAGKMRGLLDALVPHYVAYALPAAVVSCAGGLGAVAATGGSLLLVWPLLYYAAACGIYASAFTRGTWRAVAWAVLAVYVGGLVICFGMGVMAGLGFAGLFLLLYGVTSAPPHIVAGLAFVVIPLACAAALVAMGRYKLHQAEEWAFAPPRPPPLTFNWHPARRVDCEAARGRLPC